MEREQNSLWGGLGAAQRHRYPQGKQLKRKERNCEAASLGGKLFVIRGAPLEKTRRVWSVCVCIWVCAHTLSKLKATQAALLNYGLFTWDQAVFHTVTSL